MSKRLILIKHWPLLLLAVLLSSAFALLFLASMDQAKDARSAELSLDTGRAHSVPEKGLTLTTRLGTLPPSASATDTPLKPGPWWPALLFGIAFFCGWLFRNAVGRAAVSTVTTRVADQVQSNVEQTPEAIDEYRFQPGKPSQERDASAPDLAVDFPWDETALEDDLNMSSEERIARLEKQNASKAEIIKALERLVAENREKWLHQDETEARLDKHIRDLSDDLRVAVRQLQQLQTDTTTSKRLKNIV